MKKIWLGILLSGVLGLVFSTNVRAEELTLLFTGQTEAMLYNCICPREPDGGVSRRATLVKELKAKEPNVLVLDSGNFFAGGITDMYKQDTALDRLRSEINLKAMEIIGYDAVAIGDSEFNFGRQVLEENLLKIKIPAVSCNIESDRIKPYILKKVGNKQIGITGLTALASSPKSGGISFLPTLDAIKKTVLELKKKKADIIIVLSNLGEMDDLALLKEVPGMIDVLIVGANRSKEEPAIMIDSVLVLKPVWQGRKLGKVKIFLQNNKILNFHIEELRLSDKIANDKQIQEILPRCFSDKNCPIEGMVMVGVCQNPGLINASCQFIKANKVPLLIINSTDCRTCDTEGVVKMLKAYVPGMEVNYQYSPGEKADMLIRDLGVKTLPIYLLAKEVEKEKDFAKLKPNLEEKSNYYMVNPQIGGIGYFIDRPKVEDKMDLFISLYAKGGVELLENVKEFNPAVHFLISDSPDGELRGFYGRSDVEESLRQVCTEKYYPGYAWNYLSCRAKNIDSSWWEDCLEGLDPMVVKECARGVEGKDLLRQNFALAKELKIMQGPTYLLDNQEIFSSVKVPSKEELRKIITAK